MTIELRTAEQCKDFIGRYDTFLLDCDGVIWQGNELIPGVKNVLKTLKSLGKRLLFVTNNSTKSRSTYLAKFTSLQIETTIDEIFGSAYCAAYYMKNRIDFPKHKKVYVCGMKGICDELDDVGIEWVGADRDNQQLKDMGEMAHLDIEADVGAVLLGFDIDFNYKKLAKAFTHLRDPATLFLATNDDLTYPAGTGAMLAALTASTGRTPLVLGKPHLTMLDCIVDKWHLDRGRTCMIGDRLDTDIAFGVMGKVGTLLVLTGVTDRSEIDGDIKPEFLIESLGNLQ